MASEPYSRKMSKKKWPSFLKPKMILLLLALGMAVTSVGGEDSKCSCAEPKINHVSPLSFGMTLLSPSYSLLYLNVSSPNEIVIKEPSEPIWFNNKEYFWDNAYHQAGLKHSTVCSYRIPLHQKELRKVRYNRTHRPSNVTFGCNWYEECCDLGCCTNSILQLAIFIFLYAGIGFMIVTFCSQLPVEAEEEREMNRARADLGIFYPCHPNDGSDPIEDFVLSEIVNQEGPPKYDELYPDGSSYTQPLTTPSQPPQFPLETIEEVDSSVDNA